MTAAIPILIFVFGLLIGSFLNVCIYRIPLNKTIVKGRSYCTSCNSLIPWYCNIPLFSYIFLRGRCLNCGEKISPIYPAVELLNAVLYLLLYWVYGLSVPLLFFAALFSILVVLSFIDLKYQIIPDGLVVAMLVLGVANGFYQTVFLGVPWQTWVIRFFAASVPLFILGLIFPEGMGGGDIKLMAAAGLFIGWKLILLSLFAGALYGGVVSIFVILVKKGSRKTALPFGPMLSLGIITCVLAGYRLLALYLSIIL
ncbi:prepilin peptidase [Parasporobacterium paucivorans]|uniref:Prepilin leader peptidase/N-methyltransferase n=1 Tax=Parasporobacterium paucivorans DSM 15970 TaxID=1122934 RepID=A0A1M6ISC6_9FIRM|nr:A24 family peptidase [Parasporobacterium paucivorans]SHJ37318.1 leader peptidase (prepilin peptidase) / N-methyltransferase [Parasporobacterium paucivorans DSM 15970]